VVIRHTALINIPSELSSVDAAPILCAGTATFNALRYSGTKAGDRVAILGAGGLGHMAIQYARKMGYEVIVIARGGEKERAAIELGAHHYINALSENVAERLKTFGRVNVILATARILKLFQRCCQPWLHRGKRYCWGPDAHLCRLCRG
jgi:alcohol dehydrogenase